MPAAISVNRAGLFSVPAVQLVAESTQPAHDTEEEFHDDHDVHTIDAALVVDLLKLGRVLGISAPNSWKRSTSCHLLTSVADASGLCASVTCPSALRLFPNSFTVGNLARPKLGMS